MSQRVCAHWRAARKHALLQRHASTTYRPNRRGPRPLAARRIENVQPIDEALAWSLAAPEPTLLEFFID